MSDIEKKEIEFISGWTGELLKTLESFEDKNNLFKNCADYHYRWNNMKDILQKYKGNLTDFLKFLEKEWGWIISVSEDKTVLMIDENKEQCVCPVVCAMKGEVSKIICRCSEQFAKKMFSEVVGKEVQAKVVRSLIRDGKSCVYEIRLQAK